MTIIIAKNSDTSDSDLMAKVSLLIWADVLQVEMKCFHQIFGDIASGLQTSIYPHGTF